MADYQIVGAIGSPYSRKLRAVFRYRRIAHVWIHQGDPEAEPLPKPRVALLPQLVFADERGEPQAHVDSTPLIRLLEIREGNTRSVLPPDPALAFVDALIEDYADEWLTKAMFHYRWSCAPDIEKASRILPRWAGSMQPDARLDRAGRGFAERQIGRLAVVGSSARTSVIIERSFERLLAILERHLERFRFLLGGRPGTADFGLYGQLTQLALFDPTPMGITLARAPRVFAYADRLDDLSGVEPRADDWIALASLPETIPALLAEIGRTYVPFLLANAEALTLGRERVVCEIDDTTWEQAPFPYQSKCLDALRRGYEGLDASARGDVDRALSGTGCEPLLG